MKDMKPFSQAAFFTGTYGIQNNTEMDLDPSRNPHILCFSEISQLGGRNKLSPLFPYFRLTVFCVFQENMLAEPRQKILKKNQCPLYLTIFVPLIRNCELFI